MFERHPSDFLRCRPQPGSTDGIDVSEQMLPEFVRLCPRRRVFADAHPVVCVPLIPAKDASDLAVYPIGAWPGDVRNADSSEHERLAWFDPEELARETLAHPAYREILAALCRRLALDRFVGYYNAERPHPASAAGLLVTGSTSSWPRDCHQPRGGLQLAHRPTIPVGRPRKWPLGPPPFPQRPGRAEILKA